MLDKNSMALIAMSGDVEICIQPEMLNRHGLITGATGTGKTVSLQTLAETFSALGIPVFLADVKGDLSGIGMAGDGAGKAATRARELGLVEKGWQPQSFPVCFWDVFGKKGLPVRVTISDLGPDLLSRLLNLSDVQSGVLRIVFRIADDQGLLLLDLKDLRSMALHVGEERETYKSQYGQIAPASIGAIQRALLRLDEEGGELFFGEPALNIRDLIRTVDGKGVINILDATMLINSPALYSCLLLWLLSELYETMPETGDMQKPKLVFFFDEAHLLFEDIEPALLQKIEQITRLIRSRGVGIFFVSQNPADIPDKVLGQLGNRIQHALRAFTPRDQKSVRAAAQAFRPNPDFNAEEIIGQLGVGEALISFLDENGIPGIVRRALVAPPEGRIGPLSDAERKELPASSPLKGIYENGIDRESAYELLSARARNVKNEEQDQIVATDKRKNGIPASASRKTGKNRKTAEASLGDILDTAIKQTTRAMGTSVGRAIGNSIVRGLLGSLMRKK